MPDRVHLYRRLRYISVAMMLLAALLTGRARVHAATSEQVDAAIKRATASIYARQKPTGQWEDDLRRTGEGNEFLSMQGVGFGGWTALATFSLLEAGEKPSDPRIIKALEFLRNCNMYGGYAIGLRCMVWSKLPPTPENLRFLQNDANRLVASLIREGDAAGMWDYESDKPAGQRQSSSVDHSLSQFAVLGLWAAVQGGASVPPETWKVMDKAWRQHQNNDGGWSYDGGHESKGSTISMTAAGVATLLIVQDILGTVPTSTAGADAPAGQSNDLSISRGLSWLSRNLAQADQQGGYALYGIERIGTAGGFRYIGKVDWYALGANALLSHQDPEGSWGSGQGVGSTPVVEAAFNVLFLAHGRNPVLINKLNYSAVLEGYARDAGWNQRPRDASNLTRFIGHSLEQPFNWQVVSFAASTEDLLESPVLLTTGGKMVVFTEKEREKLRGFIDGGGLMLMTSESVSRDGVAGKDEFSKSMVQLAKSLFPNYAFRELPTSHVIFTEQQYKAAHWEEKPVVWGLSNGVRELMILLPTGDMGKAWNSKAQKTEEAKFELGADIVQYAFSRLPPRAKGRSFYVKPRYFADPATRPSLPEPVNSPPPDGFPDGARFIKVGQLRIGENWNPEPGAWRRLSTVLANDSKLFVDVLPLDADSSQLNNVKLVHWTGTAAVKLIPAQRLALQGFVKRGGTLLVDAAGGSAAFAESAQAELAQTFGTTGSVFGTLLGADDPLYRLTGFKIDKFEYRRYAVSRVTGKLDAPRIRGLEQSGRTSVYFSREDLTAGCVGPNVDGIIGYAPATATAIVRNIALSAAKGK